jgi:hypothetical protein
MGRAHGLARRAGSHGNQRGATGDASVIHRAVKSSRDARADVFGAVESTGPCLRVKHQRDDNAHPEECETEESYHGQVQIMRRSVANSRTCGQFFVPYYVNLSSASACDLG